MKCPNCQRENNLAANFCIFCGAPLLPGETPSPSEEELKDTVRRLGELINAMNDRLAALERQQGIKEAPKAAPTPAAAARPSAPTPPPTEVPEAVPKSSKLYATIPPPAEEEKRQPTEWEQILGGSWLARIGVLLLIIGAGFFLKYAFDQNWLGPAARIILGVVAGLGLLTGGHFWRRRYPTFSQALSGGGIALLYLSIFAAFAFFDMLNIYVAVGLLFLISGGSAVLALRYNSMALAIIGILGAFIAPFILGSFEMGGAGGGSGFQLLVYIIVVDLGVLALSAFRNWRWFILLAFLGTFLSFIGWYAQFGDQAGLALAETSLTILFLIFTGATAFYHFIWRKPAEESDYALMIVNAAAYLGGSYAIMWSDMRGWMGGFTLLLVIFYGSLAWMAIVSGARRLGFFALGIATVLFTIAIPIQLGDVAWTTIAWAALGTVLIWLAIRFRMTNLRYFGYIVFGLVAIRLFFFDTPISLQNFQPIINERFLAFALAIAAMYLSGYLIWRVKGTVIERTSAVALLWMAANFFTIWVLSLEVWNHFATQLPAASDALRNAQNLSLTGLWALYAMLLLVLGIIKRWRPVRLWALVLLIVPIGKLFVYDVWVLETVYRIVAFVGLGLLLIIGAYLYQRYGKAIRSFITDK